ncbi:MAG TPA: dihydropteroate synthase [bacterium]|nr:dihydropteroate synthase [bacterium]
MLIGTHPLQTEKPSIMGVVNVTPDSFSDGGLFADTSSAIAHALKLAEWGADIVDIGGESTRPGAAPVSEDEELRRVIPVIEGVRKNSNVPISIDTTKSLVAQRAIKAGAVMINDISAGRFDPEILEVAAESRVPICLMHMQGNPKDMQRDPHYDDLLGEIAEFLNDSIVRAKRAGVAKDMLIVDPGIGFGKTPQDNVKILKNLNSFSFPTEQGRDPENNGRKETIPILVGTSRKSFLGKLLGFEVNNRLEGTLATIAIAIDRGASILRVHDVEQARRFVDTYLLLHG